MELDPGRPQFTDYDEVYFADACEPLHQAAARGQVDLHAVVHGDYPGAVLADDVLAGIGTVGFWNASRSQNWGLDWHRNEGIEVTYLDRGTLDFSTRNRDWTLEPGQFTVTRPWQEHRVGLPHVAASRLHWVIIDVQVRRPHQEWLWPDWIGLAAGDLARLTTFLQDNENPVWSPDATVGSAFDLIRQVVRTPQAPAFESELRLAISQLMLGLLRASERRPAPPAVETDLRSPRRAVRMFLEELDDHLDHAWTLAEMAAAARLGRSQFSRYCRELTNMTPVQYLTSRRLNQAKRLLREEADLSITDIAMITGFQSSQYFATVFRRHVGITARDFRSAERAAARRLARPPRQSRSTPEMPPQTWAAKSESSYASG